ncbi:MAG: EpsG family protein [Oscillospiraceae bacterium]|nr:EpsG family protein [Oscillospiraceae bacterium]
MFYIAELPQFRNKKKGSTLFSIIAIIFPALLAGLRDSSVGTDVELYGNFWFEYAVRYDFVSYISFADDCGIGIAYALLNYVVSIFTEEVGVFYFVLSFVETTLVYIAAREFKEKISVSFAMFCYYTIFYNNTLNLLRQFLAVSVIFLAYKYLIRERYWISFFIILLGVQCHSSAMFSFVLILLYVFVMHTRTKLGTYTLNVFMFSVVCVIMILYKKILLLILKLGILPLRYSTYVEDTVVGGRLIRTVFWLIIAVFAYFAFSKMINYYRNNKFLISCMTISLAFSLVMFMGNVYAIRMSFYFDMAAVIIVPMIPRIYKAKVNNLKMKHIMYFLLIILLVIRWYLEYVHACNGQTYPYKFA